jgi:hypothetical protein
MSRCGPWHYRGKKNRWRECREMHMSAEDRAWMLEHSEEESRPVHGVVDRSKTYKQLVEEHQSRQLDETFARWVDAYEPPQFPITPPPQWLYQKERFKGGGAIDWDELTKPPQPEQYGISDDTNERARRLIESALGDDT